MPGLVDRVRFAVALIFVATYDDLMSARNDRTKDVRGPMFVLASPSPSLTEQIREAVAKVGTQQEVRRRVLAAGGKLTQGMLSELCNGAVPSVQTLRYLAEATGAVFTINGATEIGQSRAPRPSEAAEEKAGR